MLSPAPLAQTLKARAISSAAGAVEPLHTQHSNSDRLVTGYLIDWVTLRIKARMLPPLLRERLDHAHNIVACFEVDPVSGDATELVWRQSRFDINALRSDEKGLFVSVKPIGADDWLYIGGSPASILYGCNVFGSLDVVGGADLLRDKAMQCLNSTLPPLHEWECVRLDVTGNYALPDAAAVKLALKQLAMSDSARRRATSAAKGGDSVYWSPTSDLIAGKAYHKGPHLEHLIRAGKLQLPPEQVEAAGRLLRLELKIGSRWFRRLKDGQISKEMRGLNWSDLTGDHLKEIYQKFFGPLVGDVEVTGMERVSLEKRIELANAMSPNAARSVLGTYRAIKAEGFDATKHSMALRTFRRHVKALRAAGLTDSELVAGNVFQFRPVKIVLALPVRGWEELRRVA